MFKIGLLTSTLTLATVLFTSSASFAEQHQGGMHDKGATAFKNADKDNDGTLDKEEAKAMPNVAKNFDAIDTDKDGTVSLDEIHSFMKAHHQGGMHGKGATAFKNADKDNDGTLDKEEAKKMPNVAKNFDAIDTDKDGTVSLDEIHSFMKAHHQVGMHGKGATAFKNADKDNDGTLDKEEAKAMPNVAKNFDAIDTDKDGTVSLDEIDSFMKAHHQGGMHKQ